jgi:phospholipase/carboxylesterase
MGHVQMRSVVPRLAAVVALGAVAVGCGHKPAGRAAARNDAVAEVARAREVVASGYQAPRHARSLPRAGVDGVYETGGLRYVVHLTGGARADEKLPLVIDLPGGNAQPQSTARHVDGLLHEKARVVIPYGGVQFGRGYAWFPQGSGHANAHADLARAMPPVISRVSRGIDAIAAAWPTQGKPVVAGFSQGAELTYALALTHPQEFGYACALSGQVPPEVIRRAHPSGQLPEVHGYHGDRDNLIDVRDAKRTVSSLRRLGFTADLKEYPERSHNDAGTGPDFGACIARGVRRASPSNI